MTTQPIVREERKFTCTDCGRAHTIDGHQYSPPGEQARVAGWRFGVNGRGEQVCYCPDCTGVDEDYWDDKTLAMAHMAGIDAGNQAWTAA